MILFSKVTEIVYICERIRKCVVEKLRFHWINKGKVVLRKSIGDVNMFSMIILERHFMSGSYVRDLAKIQGIDM